MIHEELPSKRVSRLYCGSYAYEFNTINLEGESKFDQGKHRISIEGMLALFANILTIYIATLLLYFEGQGKVHFMVDLATSVLAVLSPYLIKGAEKFVEEFGKESFHAVQRLYSTLKEGLLGDEEAESTLANFEKKPERYSDVFTEVLGDKFAVDQDFAMEMNEIVKNLPPSLAVHQDMAKGENVTGIRAAHISAGEATVSQKIVDAKNVIGIDVGQIG